MMISKREYDLVVTTQGPTYPPSEVMDKDGNFIIIGRINTTVNPEKALKNVNGAHGTASKWGGAIVSQKSPIPAFGKNLPYDIIREFDIHNLSEEDKAMVFYTLPIPLPCNNYPMIFAPAQEKFEDMRPRSSYPLHCPIIKDLRTEDGWKITEPITLGNWVKAKGKLTVELANDASEAIFTLNCTGLIPNGLYTIMSLRENDFNVKVPTRPGPLGIPNVMIADEFGNGRYRAVMPNPFPDKKTDPKANRIINVILLWMAYQRNYGGAMALFGLGGDVQAQLKLSTPSFHEFITHPKLTSSSVKKVFAFFDVDDTILKFKSMFSFQEHYFLNYTPFLLGKLYSHIFTKHYKKHLLKQRDREFINKFYYQSFKGRLPETVQQAGKSWLKQVKQDFNNDIYFEKILTIIKAHQQNGVEVILVSGSMPALLEPIAHELNIKRIICTQLETKNGLYTGKIIPPQTIGAGKAEAIRHFLKQENGDASASFAYADHISDLQMLEAVGHPTIVSKDPEMILLAKARNWKIINPHI